MITKQFLSLFSIRIILLLLVTGCNVSGTDKPEYSGQETSATQLTISAAASLQDVMKAIKPLYQNIYPNRKIVYNFAASGSLQRQIEQGAPVDVFISAAVDKMDTLEKKDLILTQTRRNLLKNQIVLVTQNENKADLNFNDLTRETINLIALGEPESVPAGKYAKQVLNFFNIADTVQAKAVYGTDVRQVLHYVETGNVDAGIVYQTDAKVSDQVTIVAMAPEDSHSPVIYPIAVIKDSNTPDIATEFIEFLTTDQAKAVFQEYGFVPITND